MPITIPLRGGDLILDDIEQHGPERATQSRVVLADRDSGVFLSMPRDLFDRLVEIGDVVMVVDPTHTQDGGRR